MGSIARLVVSLIRYSSGEWQMTPIREKFLRCTLDDLETLHGMPHLGQQRPMVVTVRVYRRRADRIDINTARIRDDISQFYPGRDVECRIRAIVVSRDASSAIAYLIPWEKLEGTLGVLSLPVEDLPDLRCDLPDHIDLASIARDLYIDNEGDSIESEEEC